MKIYEYKLETQKLLDNLGKNIGYLSTNTIVELLDVIEQREANVFMWQSTLSDNDEIPAPITKLCCWIFGTLDET